VGKFNKGRRLERFFHILKWPRKKQRRKRKQAKRKKRNNFFARRSLQRRAFCLL